MTRKNTVRTIEALLLAALLGVAASKNSMASDADDQKASGDLSVGIGAEHETGKYGTTQTTRSWTVPLEISYDTDNYAFDLAVPFVRQTGPAGSIAGRIRRRPRQAAPVVTDSGIGDSTVSATRYLVQDDKAGVTLGIGVVVKFDTGDVKKGLGTGANDYSVQAELAKSLDNFALTGTLGYSWLGSPGFVVINRVRQNLQFQDVTYGSVDGSYPIGTKTRAGLTYFQEQATEAGGFPQKDVTAYVSIKTSDSTRFRFYFLKGLADGSPAHGVGVTATASF